MDSTGTAVRPVIDRRERSRIGRQARLELVFERRGGTTVLAQAYAEPPFRAGHCFPDADGLHMILASSAPGIFGGDRFELNIRVAQGARVRFTSQSALQIHPSQDGALAQAVSRYQVDDHAELICDWDPMIPFGLARFEQRIDIRLAPKARLLWSDAFMAGRASHRSFLSEDLADGNDGERWAFNELAHELSVRRGDSLEYLERYRLTPREQGLDREWIAASVSYLGTVVSSGWPVDAGRIAELHGEVSRWPGVRAAADRLDAQLALVRAVGIEGASFHRMRRHVVTSLRPSGQNR